MIDNLHNVGANYKSTKTNSQIVVQSLCSTPHKRNTPEKKKPFYHLLTSWFRKCNGTGQC